LVVDVPVEEAVLDGTVSEQVLKEADLPSELSYSLKFIFGGLVEGGFL